MRSQQRDESEEDDEDWDDREDPDEADQDDSDDPELVPCPYCREKISEDADLCPHCGSYVSLEDAPSNRPKWLVIGAVAVIVAILLVWVIRGS